MSVKIKQTDNTLINLMPDQNWSLKRNTFVEHLFKNSDTNYTQTTTKQTIFCIKDHFQLDHLKVNFLIRTLYRPLNR